GLYQGALMGAQRITISSIISMVMVTIGNLGAVVVLAFVSPTIEGFFIWQACVGLVYAITMRGAAWKIIGKSDQIRFDANNLKSVWRFTAGMSGIGLTSLAFTQLDKVILSKMLALEEFGHYMLATVVVSGLSVLIVPVYNVVYPRFSALVATGDTTKLMNLYRLGTRMLGTVLFPIAMLLAIFSEYLVRVWTGNSDIASSVAPIISLLVIGSSLNGVMFFPYALQLAYGMTWIPLTINIVLMLFLVPLIIFLAQTYGALGGAMAWLTTEIAYLMLGPWLTHRYLLKGLAFRWLLSDVGIPLLMSILVGLFGYYVTHVTVSPVYVKLVCGIGLAIFTSAMSIWLSPQLRSAMWHYIGSKK
ncbi:MAG: oligosaccharide flippase family protein, partial [Gammaproteobacteria bacterium]